MQLVILVKVERIGDLSYVVRWQILCSPVLIHEHSPASPSFTTVLWPYEKEDIRYKLFTDWAIAAITIPAPYQIFSTQ